MPYLPFFLAFLFVIGANQVVAQDKSKALISFRNDVVLVSVNNPFSVTIQQKELVSLDQLSAVLVTYGEEPEPIPLEISQYDSKFVLRPAEAGSIIINVRLRDGTKEQFNFSTQPLTAVSKLGAWGGENMEPVKTNVFKSQSGIYAQVEGFDINALCNIISYDIIIIVGNEDARIISNEGGDFQLAARRFINQAKPGDRYVFTKIRYRCPGAQSDQFGETLSFELK